MDLVVFDIFESGIGSYVVENAGFYLLAESLLELCHVDMTFAEAGYLTVLTDILKFFLHAGGIICFFDFYDQPAFELAGLFECYVHYVSVFMYVLYFVPLYGSTEKPRLRFPNCKININFLYYGHFGTRRPSFFR